MSRMINKDTPYLHNPASHPSRVECPISVPPCNSGERDGGLRGVGDTILIVDASACLEVCGAGFGFG